ncbi:hypothetical protein [Janthinobacterium agaricidamnosum]|uniref:Uncharacterized protein n=1 Tax=Janthinobacterium agaricidamnosum NBRC 102515 = DSM 9628 TaxID=1349767 RepID=W0V8Q6_9BURK|nr:hypothetical protein [Janthinobacterium agaricidamnosum]CDG83738.1 hypothetical protein GJA_3113 [Janthinobacterium agaricidamnosum NBRC 102515 = DSM 9628]
MKLAAAALLSAEQRGGHQGTAAAGQRQQSRANRPCTVYNNHFGRLKKNGPPVLATF